MRCLICQREFTAKRSDAKTCSPRCRTRLSRAIAGQDKDITAVRNEDGSITIERRRSPRVEANQKAPTHYWHIRKAIDTAKYSMDRLEEVWDSAAPSKRADITFMHPSIVRELRDLADRLERLGFGEPGDAR
ncbi:hypothetical protein H6A68_02930 [Bifidobacterium pullorum subsp. saeculare]|uniref:hypothetical protein n=1 Tax=Bifidobacterium pullorum TaxID=78448 RepID=UPI00195D0E7A|nr:hypothetical protein [Bifidobacterium pullorum]MBM6706018.1 hypothetical protein [Bifidobacterium pullorum subsp. saeculare]